MRTRWQVSSLLTLIPIVALAAWHGRAHLSGPTAVTDSAWSALTGPIATMHASMSAVRPSGQSDVDFVNLMLPHHQAAIDMAKAELLYGTDQEMRRLAQEIITDQQSEIELMDLWLKRHQ
ncbi:MAG TPA: DUF305 domain-containing protein [Gemmatimonadales bacterium]|nr:DUF305 domain-containing protein [Gemmatimonadales bacterium]